MLSRALKPTAIFQSFFLNFISGGFVYKPVGYVDQVWGQDGWILAKFFFCVFMDRDGVEVHKLAKKEANIQPAQKKKLAQ